jgi:hypothetical protein
LTAGMLRRTDRAVSGRMLPSGELSILWTDPSTATPARSRGGTVAAPTARVSTTIDHSPRSISPQSCGSDLLPSDSKSSGTLSATLPSRQPLHRQARRCCHSEPVEESLLFARLALPN